MGPGLRRVLMVVGVLTSIVLALILLGGLFMILMMAGMMGGMMIHGGMGAVMGSTTTAVLISLSGLLIIVGLVWLVAWSFRQAVRQGPQ